MSAFIVSNQCIGKIVWQMARKTDSQDPEPECPDLGVAAEFGAKLRHLNVRAVNVRYQERNRSARAPIVPQACSLVEAYAALRCWLYQCYEGNVPNTKLYKRMERLSADWAHRIVHQLDAYKSASWG